MRKRRIGALFLAASYLFHFPRMHLSLSPSLSPLSSVRTCLSASPPLSCYPNFCLLTLVVGVTEFCFLAMCTKQSGAKTRTTRKLLFWRSLYLQQQQQQTALARVAADKETRAVTFQRGGCPE